MEYPEMLQKYLSTLKKASKDKNNGIFMTESKIQVVDFDKVPDKYSKVKKISSIPKSNDALYIKGNRWYFIEFKNGSIDKADIYRKIYDSLIMLVEMEIIENFEFSRENINYILVYNSDKYGKAQKSEAREEINNYIEKLAKDEEKLFEVWKFEGYLFKATHTYTKELFQERFVSLVEKGEL